MERYCKKFCKVGLVVEAQSEKDSWNSVSRVPNANKASRTDQRKGIKFKVKSIRSQGKTKGQDSNEHATGQRELNEADEEANKPATVKPSFQSQALDKV